MANTIPYQPIRLHMPGAMDSPNVYSFPIAGGQTLIEGDIATLGSGTLSKAAANVNANIAGLVMFGNLERYSLAGGTFARNSLFGPDQSNTALVPSEAQNLHVVGLGYGLILEMSLSTATTLAQSLVGTTAGFGFDATSGYFIVDPAQANKPLTIIAISAGPDSLNPLGVQGATMGVIGDSGGRVFVQCAASALAVQ